MKCPACHRDQPMSLKCRFCGEEFVRSFAPPRSGPPPAPRPVGGAAMVPAVAGGVDMDAGMAAHNPYAAPAAADGIYDDSLRALPVSDAELADRGSRLLAQLLDGLFGLVCVGPGILLVVLGSPSPSASQQPSAAMTALSTAGIFLALAGVIALIVYQLRLLAAEGQTWGKKKMGVRIVLYDTGEIPGLGRTFGLRMFVNGLPGVIPCLGTLYPIVDALFIFGQERRCLHDYLAGTKVVQAA